MTYELFGRRVVGYAIATEPMHLVIDIMQNEADCPRKIPLMLRNTGCDWDCGKSFALVHYDATKREIVARGVWLTQAQIVERSKTSEIPLFDLSAQSTLRYDNGVLTIAHARKRTMFPPGCSTLLAAPRGRIGIEEVDKFFDYIASHTEDVLAECGITITGRGRKTHVRVRDESCIRTTNHSLIERQMMSN